MTDTQTRESAVEQQQGPPTSQVPALGPWGALRFAWTQLTSMRTALVLLFCLAVAAVPGSLVPQRKVSPIRVSDFINDHPLLGPLYDKVGLFSVYTSPWFSAIYLLLFVSLVGCIIPRVGVYAKALRARPPKTPRNLARLPAYASVEVAAGDGLLERAAAELKRQRYRVVTDHTSVSAERGYLREAGNLLFHVSLLVLLLGVAIGALFGFRGTSVVIAGQGFSNNLTQYDDISAGALFSDTDLVPFTVVVKRFDAKFETGRVQRGAARLFEADVEVTERPGAVADEKKLEVNHPVNISGTTVHLVGHGYAPKVTVRDGDNNMAFSGPVVFLPQDGNFTSAGVIKAPDGRPDRLAFEGIFAPTAIEGQGPTSAFPDALIPMLYLNAWAGPPKTETGKPENVYSLNRAGLTQLKNADGSVVAMRLSPGDVFKLPNGQGTVQFDGWERWVKLQIGDTPGAVISLAAIGLAVLGLCLSLFVRPRRVWVRVVAGEGGAALVEVAGLDRADARAGLSDDVAELATSLTERKETSPT
ncbi:MAG: cytochrome c biogenesis protein ResB [Propionibacteriaceae bacterium]|nr:cytochrome c biogenesis protein ResB [Propionibacteriaceae bacterium]